MAIALDADVKTLTEEQLDTLYMNLIDRQEDVLTERRRRDALPFIWASEAAAVVSIRKALGKPEQVGTAEEPETWAQPSNPLDVYVAGDYVAHDGATWLATGRGGIYAEPGVDDPIQGTVWQKQDAESDEA